MIGVNWIKTNVLLVGIFLLQCINTALFAQRKNDFTAEERRIKAISADQTKRATTFSSKALQIGDTVPDILMGKIFNYPGGKARLSDFKGKHILLDFWAQGCKSCIGAFPKITKLQQQFTEKIQILAVCTYNTWEALNLYEPGFPKKSKSVGIRETTLPLVFNSQQMVDFFPHSSEPYLVWLDTSRVIRAMVDGGSNFNGQMIQSFLNGHYDAYPLANSFKRVVNFEKRYDNNALSILEEGNGRFINKVVYLKRSIEDSAYVVLARLGRNYGVAKSIFDSITCRQIGEQKFKLTILNLFRKAYPIDRQLVIVESHDPGKYYDGFYTGYNYNRWLNDHVYSYEVYGPTAEARRDMLREALKEYFKHIQPVKEKRKIRYLQLCRTSPEDKLGTKNSDAKTYIETSRMLFALRNCDFSFFISQLQFYNLFIHQHLALPIFDATGFSAVKHIDIELRNLDDVMGLNEQLKRYDMTLREVEGEVDVLVLKEIPAIYSNITKDN